MIGSNPHTLAKVQPGIAQAPSLKMAPARLWTKGVLAEPKSKVKLSCKAPAQVLETRVSKVAMFSSWSKVLEEPETESHQVHMLLLY